jgi:hypothetical protein
MEEFQFIRSMADGQHFALRIHGITAMWAQRKTGDYLTAFIFQNSIRKVQVS